MKTILLTFISIFTLFFYVIPPMTGFTTTNDKESYKKLDSCFFKGKKLYGKVQLVEFANQADLKLQIVSSFPDLKVRFVENFADQCGEWQIVEIGMQADLKVFITESFPDIKIQPVMNFPGLP